MEIAKVDKIIFTNRKQWPLLEQINNDFFQDRVDSLDERQKNFFASCSKRTKPGEKDEEFKQVILHQQVSKST